MGYTFRHKQQGMRNHHAETDYQCLRGRHPQRFKNTDLRTCTRYKTCRLQGISRRKSGTRRNTLGVSPPRNREELGTEIYTLDTAYQAWVELPDRIFHLHFIRSVIQDGAPEPSPQENQSMEWLETAELDSVNMLPADVGIAKLLAESARKTAES